MARIARARPRVPVLWAVAFPSVRDGRRFLSFCRYVFNHLAGRISRRPVVGVPAFVPDDVEDPASSS